MMRFETKITRSEKELDGWLNFLLREGNFVKVVSSLSYEDMGYRVTQTTLMYGQHSEREVPGGKKTLTESQPEEFEEPAINIEDTDEGS